MGITSGKRSQEQEKDEPMPSQGHDPCVSLPLSPMSHGFVRILYLHLDFGIWFLDPSIESLLFAENFFLFFLVTLFSWLRNPICFVSTSVPERRPKLTTEDSLQFMWTMKCELASEREKYNEFIAIMLEFKDGGSVTPSVLYFCVSQVLAKCHCSCGIHLLAVGASIVPLDIS